MRGKYVVYIEQGEGGFMFEGITHDTEAAARVVARKVVVGGAKQAQVLKCICVAKPSVEFDDPQITAPKFQQGD